MSKISVFVAAAMLALLGTTAFSAQDRCEVRAQRGLSFSEARGYDKWPVIRVSAVSSSNIIEAVVGNPEMIAAFQAGIPGNGKSFPDGAKMAKIQWNSRQSTDPVHATIPDTLRRVDIMVKDSARFPDAGGWGFQQFNYDIASDTFSPSAEDVKCGVACHTTAKDRDYVFTAFQKR